MPAIDASQSALGDCRLALRCRFTGCVAIYDRRSITIRLDDGHWPPRWVVMHTSGVYVCARSLVAARRIAKAVAAAPTWNVIAKYLPLALLQDDLRPF